VNEASRERERPLPPPARSHRRRLDWVLVSKRSDVRLDRMQGAPSHWLEIKNEGDGNDDGEGRVRSDRILSDLLQLIASRRVSPKPLSGRSLRYLAAVLTGLLHYSKLVQQRLARGCCW